MIIADLSIEEEVARLSMFFPHADMRIACSFFALNSTQQTFYNNKEVHLFPAVIRGEITQLKQSMVEKHNQILVYISNYSSFIQSAQEVIGVL